MGKEKTMTNEQLFEQLWQKLEALERRLQQVDVTEESKNLWTRADIAIYFQVSQEHANKAIIPSPYFPSPVVMGEQRDLTKPSKHLRWFAGDVVRYAAKIKRR